MTVPGFLAESCFQENYDYSGGDISGYAPRRVFSVMECQDLCKKHSECKYFTVEKASHSRSWNLLYATGRCWLKYGPEKWTAETHNTRRISGPRDCMNHVVSF